MNTSANNQAYSLTLLPALDSSPSLNFPQLQHTLHEGGPPLTFRRLCDRPPNEPAATLDSGANKVTFNTKVMSRLHAEIWADNGDRIFIKDTKSVGGTFINGTRLSPSSEESVPFELHNGDILQFGNNTGAEGDMYKCVKLKVECTRI